MYRLPSTSNKLVLRKESAHSTISPVTGSGERTGLNKTQQLIQ